MSPMSPMSLMSPMTSSAVLLVLFLHLLLSASSTTIASSASPASSTASSSSSSSFIFSNRHVPSRRPLSVPQNPPIILQEVSHLPHASYVPSSQITQINGRNGRGTLLVMMAKKKRKKSSSDENGDNFLESATDNSKVRESSKTRKQNVDGPIRTSGNSASSGSSGSSAVNPYNEVYVDNGDNADINSRPKRTTLRGGPSLIFEMARRMLVWDDELYQGLNDAGSRDLRDGRDSRDGGSSAASALGGLSGLGFGSNNSTFTSIIDTGRSSTTSTTTPPSLPRWRPSPILQQSISNINPSFRTSSPLMTNAGYAGILRRNSRKKRKPSMWRHCLRVYKRMEELEKGELNVNGVNSVSEANEVNGSVQSRGQGSAMGSRVVNGTSIPSSNAYNSANSASAGNSANFGSAANAADSITTNKKQTKRTPKIQRRTPHHEAALVAASKLGLWEEALRIYRTAENSKSSKGSSSTRTSRTGRDTRDITSGRRGIGGGTSTYGTSGANGTNGVASNASSRGRSEGKRKSGITDNMVLSVINACVKGSRVKRATVSYPRTNDSGTISPTDGDAVSLEVPSVDIADIAASGETVETIESMERAGKNSSDTNESNTTELADGSATPDAERSAATTADLSNSASTMPEPVYYSTVRTLTVEERRKPLDAARDIVQSLEEQHDIPIVSRHINPLAAAYLRLGLRSEAAALIQTHLRDRAPPPPPPKPPKPPKPVRSFDNQKYRKDSSNDAFDAFDAVPLVSWSDDDDDVSAVTLDDILANDANNANDANVANDDEETDETDETDLTDDEGYNSSETQLNIHDLQSKDRASYSLLVKGAVMDSDWVGAVEELKKMTSVGLYPNARNLNSWSEVLERGCRPTSGEDEDRNGMNGNGYGNGNFYGGRRRRRSWKKKRDGMWLEKFR